MRLESGSCVMARAPPRRSRPPRRSPAPPARTTTSPWPRPAATRLRGSPPGPARPRSPPTRPPPPPPLPGAAVSQDAPVRESAAGTRFAAFAAGPATPGRCGVVVLPDVRGLHGFYEELTLRLGGQNIAGFAIDYFG